jgi:hypothetical protein
MMTSSLKWGDLLLHRSTVDTLLNPSKEAHGTVKRFLGADGGVTD